MKKQWRDWESFNSEIWKKTNYERALKGSISTIYEFHFTNKNSRMNWFLILKISKLLKKIVSILHADKILIAIGENDMLLFQPSEQ